MHDIVKAKFPLTIAERKKNKKTPKTNIQELSTDLRNLYKEDQC